MKKKTTASVINLQMVKILTLYIRFIIENILRQFIRKHYNEEQKRELLHKFLKEGKSMPTKNRKILGQSGTLCFYYNHSHLRV